MFQLVFRGECTSGTDEDTARQNARSLFKATADQVAKMFSGQRVVIRNRLDEAQADKYRAVLKKHGMVAYVEPMPGEAGPRPSEPRPAAAPAPAAKPVAEKAAERTATVAGRVAVEPGERLPVAGERVDDILASSGLSLDPVGVPLAETNTVEPPLFEHLDEWTLAPAGSTLADRSEAPPPVVPDVSHLTLAEDEPGNA